MTWTHKLMRPRTRSNILPQVDFYLKEREKPMFLNGTMNFKRIKCLIYTDRQKLQKDIKILYWEYLSYRNTLLFYNFALYRKYLNVN